jgi:hypothetical protein
MKKIIAIILGIVFITSCSKSETFKGDLYFKLVSFNSSNGFSSEQIEKMGKILDTLNINHLKEENDKVFYEEFLKLKQHNLLKSSSIFIKSKNEIRKIYLDKNSFQKIEKYTFDHLRKNQAKVEIELNTIELEPGIYKSENIISINEVHGETPWNK